MLIASAFRGLNSRTEPHLLEPGVAQDLSNVVLDSGALVARNAPGAALAGTGLPPAASCVSLYKFGSRYLATTVDWQYAEYGGKLYRAAAGQTPGKSSDGATWQNLGITAPTTMPATAIIAGASSLSLNTTYSYYVTYTNASGGESAPAPVTTATTGAVSGTNNKVDVDLTFAISADTQVTGRKIYRGGGGASIIGLVGTVADNTTILFQDTVADTAIGAPLTTLGCQTPDQLANAFPAAASGNRFEGIAIAPNGVFFGWVGIRLWINKQTFPDFWGSAVTDATGATVAGYVDFPEAIRAVLPYAGQVLVITIAGAYVLAGTNATNFQLQRTRCQDGCIGRDTVVDMGGYGVFWLGPKGIAQYQGGGSKLLSRDGLSEAFMAQVIAGATPKAVRNGERYLLFFPNAGSPGGLEWDPRLSPPWNKFSFATQVSCAHFNRADQALYVYQNAATPQVGLWEAGAAVSMTFRTGDWTGGDPDDIWHFRRIWLHHNGSNTIKVYVDGVQVGPAAGYPLTRSAMGRSGQLLPIGTAGGRLSVEITGTGKVIGLSMDRPVKTGAPDDK